MNYRFGSILLALFFAHSGMTQTFRANTGQAPSSVKFVSQQGPILTEFANHSMSMGTPGARVSVAFAHANPGSAPTVDGQTLAYRGTWQGIDIRYSGHERTLKSEYHVAPGADPNSIRLRYQAPARPRILRDGSLAVGIPGAELVDSPPIAYQDIGIRVTIPASYRIHSDGTVGFAVGPYDPAYPLVIDPVLNYSTLFGGSGDTSVTGVAVDSYGNVVVAGWTTATDLPAHGARTKNGGGTDAFVAKLSAQGNQIVWCTYLGGIGEDRAFGVALDSSNNVYVTGLTQSTNFPVAGAMQSKLLGSRNAFVTKLNSTGTTILYSTYLGGNSRDQGNGIVVDSAGSAYVTGDTSSANFPVLKGYQMTIAGGQQDAFVAKLSPAGNALVFSTFLGGTGVDHGGAIAIDGWKDVYVTGSTYSTNFPVVAATQSRIGGGQDAFVAELNAAGTALVFSSYIGGSGGTPGLGEGGTGIAIDSSSNLYVAGITSSIDFPVSSGAYQKTITNGGANEHGFVWKANPSKQIVYSTYLSGLNVDMINGLAVDAAGNAYVVGSTSSTDFPGVRAFQAAITGLTNGFVAKMNSSGSGLVYSGFLGGSSADSANCVAVDAFQNVVIGGLAQSSDFPLVNAAQAFTNGANSGFISRVSTGWYPIVVKNGIWYMDIWHDVGYDGALWTLAQRSFGSPGDIPIVGDWTNSGAMRIGTFNPTTATWTLDLNGNGVFDAGDRQFRYGNPGDFPIVGDWDGTGSVKAGYVHYGSFHLDLTGPINTATPGGRESTFNFGMATDIPIVGDWGKTGVTKVGVFRAGSWYIDYNNSHVYDAGDRSYSYGQAGDIPIVGDWDGSGTLKIGVVRNGRWYLNIAGDNVMRTGIDTAFGYGDSTFQVAVGRQ